MSLSDFDLIAILPRSPEKRSTPELLSRLAAAGSQSPELQTKLVLADHHYNPPAS